VTPQRKKKGGRVTPKGGPAGRMTAAERSGLEEIFDNMLETAPNDLVDDLLPLHVEVWASGIWSVWARSELNDTDAVELFAGEFIKYAAKRGTPEATMVLRALGAIAPEPHGSRARREANRLASAGVAERSWAALVGTGEPTLAWLSCDPVHDDGVLVMVGFDGAGGPSTIGVYVDHNANGMGTDIFAATSAIDEVVASLREDDEPGDLSDYRQLSLEEAAARWTEALVITEMTFDSPSEEFDELQPLAIARLAKLPHSGEVPVESDMSLEEREQLLDEFFVSDEVAGLWSTSGEENTDEVLESLAYAILSFSSRYVLGNPLRFSPVMVHLFCLDWAPRKVAADVGAFSLLPDLLTAWIRFVGRRRGIPEEAIAEAVATVQEDASEMIERARDPELWEPSKIFGLGADRRGIDLTDEAALRDFANEVNRNGGIDVLATSLAEGFAPTGWNRRPDSQLF
jgi:hypothetical protein